MSSGSHFLLDELVLYQTAESSFSQQSHTGAGVPTSEQHTKRRSKKEENDLDNALC